MIRGGGGGGLKKSRASLFSRNGELTNAGVNLQILTNENDFHSVLERYNTNRMHGPFIV